MTMESLKFPKFTQKLAELKKIEIDKVDAIFTQELNTIKKKYPLNPDEADKKYKELHKQWTEARMEADNRAEKLTFDLFTKNTDSIIDLLKHEIPIQIKFIALTVLNFSFYDEYKKFTQKDNPNFKDEPSEAELVFFNDDAVTERLEDILLPFLNLLKEKDERGFQKACELMEESVKNKQKILSDMRKEMLTIFEDKPQEKIPSALPILKTNTHLAKEVVSGTTKLENAIFDPRKNPVFYDADVPAIDINVGKQGKNEITTIASIDFNDMKKMGVSISHEKWITPFDREILSIASSLYAAGNEYQSPQMIFQAMSGNKEKAKLTPEIRTKIIESLRKLRATTIEIDSSQEEKAGWIKQGKYEGSLLPSERVEAVMLNGQKVIDCIHFLRNSPLYEYAEGKNQISRVNIAMLKAPVNNTTENIELKFHLLRLISSMKNPKSKLKPVIRYDTLYEYLQVDENDNDVRHKKKEIRDRVKKILSYWVEQGFILGFEEEKEEKNKITKVKILL